MPTNSRARMAERAAAPTPDAVRRRFLSFQVGERCYALPAERVAEVIRVPPLARLPESPQALLGLANLRGRIVPILSLPAMLGRPASDAAKSARAILLSGQDAAGLVVDGVRGIVSPETRRIEIAQAELTAEPGECLIGLFPLSGEENAARILDVDAMLSAAFGERTPRHRAPSSRGAGPAPLREAAAERREARVLVTFAVAGQEFALPLDSVQEIVALPDAIALVPRAEAVLVGIVAYREGLLPLMSLRALLGFSATDAASDRAKVIVTPVGGVLVGLVADRIQALLRADPDLIEPTPPMLAARTGGETRIAAMLRGEGGRLISILAPDRLFREDVMERLGEASGIARTGTTAAGAAQGDTVPLVVFRIGEDAFALPVGAVDEVARAPDRIARVPNAPDFIEGVVSLRGEVLPVIDQRKRFGLPAERTGAGRLVVVRTARHRAGLVVDSVAEVLRAPAEAIEPAPELIAGANRLVSAVATITAEERMVLLLDPDALLTAREHRLLDQFASGAASQTAP